MSTPRTKKQNRSLDLKTERGKGEGRRHLLLQGILLPIRKKPPSATQGSPGGYEFRSIMEKACTRVMNTLEKKEAGDQLMRCSKKTTKGAYVPLARN